MAHDHRHGHEEHGHTHGAVDPSVATSERGIWAVKWSFVGLFVTALLQVVVVVLSGSVALLSDTIHNFGDAMTAVPLWIAFALARLGAGRRFTFGYGRRTWQGWSSCSSSSFLPW
jgi:divalent metal cation (Fe/Co/Zn/Cd) transporter